MIDVRPIPTDANGREVRVGDIIYLQCRVAKLYPHGDGWLVDLHAGEDSGPQIHAIEPRLVELVERTPVAH